MEERVPPPPPPPQDYAPNSPKQLQLPYIGPNTYVVQVPKDQVYRVPPPENARIAESYRNSPGRDKKRSCCCWCCVFLIVIIAILLIFGALIGSLFSIVLKPKSPRFSIQRFNLKNSTHHMQYNITLKVNNPNSKVGISYNEGGDVSLSLKRKEIAFGAYPSFYQSHDNSKEFGIALKASKGDLPKEVDESMTNKKKKVHVTFSLTIHVQARMKMWLLRSGTMKYDVTCRVEVDTLAKNTRVLSQQCETKRQ